jgi:hypothetical protein
VQSGESRNRKGSDLVKLLGSLSVLAILTVLAPAPVASMAQTASPAAATVSSSAPALYAGLDRPAAFSSSVRAASSAFFAGAAPAKPAADSGSAKPFSSLGVGFKIGLAGIGFDVATPLVPSRLNLRGGATFFSYNLNETTNDNLNVVGNLKLQNSGVMLDWFPFRGSFRLSGGATVYNNKAVTATLNEPSGSSFTLGNDKYYAASGGITGNGTFKLGGNAGGRVSFGWGNLVPKPGHHFSFDTELGIEFVSKPTVALGFTGNYCTGSANCESPTPIAGNATFAADVASEQSKLQSDVNFLSFYPIVSFGIGYKIGH